MSLAWEKLSSIGPYTLQKLLGTGGMGKVYLGRQHGTDFALKFLEAPQHGETLHYFKQEARLLSLLSNPRLVKIYDFHETKNGVPPFFVMDYVAGVPLDQIPKDSSVETWLNLFMQCLEGLQYLHHRNVLHRDLKPSNILVTPIGAIKILDFSLSTRLAEGTTSQKIHGGTLPYLPQEAFLGIYEKRSDLFALGVVFYQAISGRLPYSQALRPESLSSVKKPLPLRQLRGDLPEFFSDLIDRLLELHPDRRPSSALTALRYLAQHGYKSEIELGEIRELLEKPPWVDRDLEWKQALASLQNARNGDAPRFLAVKGPTGVGRSRFIEELRWKLLLESKNFWMIQAHEHEDWREVLCRSAELEVTALDTFGLAEALAEKMGTRSGVLALTDLHTWKEHDWENLKVFLQALHRSPSRWAVILEINSDFAHLEDRFSPAMMQRLELKTIELKDLDAATTRQLILGSMAGEPLPEASIEAVVRGSGGRPLLVLESLRQILAGDGDPASILLPKNLEEAAQNKVKELSSEAQRLLAWVLSHDTDVSDADLDALDPKAMSQAKAWLELQQASLLEWGERGLLTLSYPGLRQALHQALPDDLISQCHRQWLAYLENPQYPHAQNPQTVIRIMEHALALHDEATLVRHGLQALSRLDQTGEYERALVWSQTLLDLPEHPIPLSRLHAQRAPLFYRLARYPESLEAYEQWYHHRQDDESQLQRVKYFFYRGLVYFAWGKAKDCAENFQKCLSTSDPQTFPALRPYYVRAYLILASLHDQARHLPQARQCLERAAELKVEDPQLVGEIYLRLGELEMKEMHFIPAEAHFKKCLSCFESTQAPQGLGLAHNALTILYKEMGRWTEALPHAAQAVQAAKDCGEKVAWARYRGNQGVVFSDLGRHGEALQAMEDSKNILEIMGSPEENWVAQLQTIQAFLAAGNFSRANAQMTHLLKEKAGLEKADLWNSLLSIRAEAAYLVRDEALADQLFGAMLNSPQGLSPLIESLARVGIAKARFIAGVEMTEEELAWRPKAEKSGSHLLACWSKTFGFLLSDPQSLSREALELIVSQTLALGSPETRLEILTLIELSLTRHGLKILAKSVLAERKRIWESIYHLLPEELKMDYEKNRGLFDVEKSLQQPIRQTSEAVSIAPQAQAMGVPEQTKISEDRFRQFCEITRQISQGDDLDAILEQVMDASIILTGAERGFLILKNEKVKDGAFPGFEVKTARHINQQALKEEDFQVSLSLVNKAIIQGAPVFTENALEDSRFQEMKSIHLYQLKSVVVIPLELSGKILGVLYLDHRYRPNCFSQEDLTILSGFAGQAGLAIQKAQIMRALQNANQNLETQVKDQAQQLVVLNEELTQARKNLKYEYKDIVGSSPAMIRVFKLLDHVTKTRIPVWVWGESGTGKELIAVSLHQNSPRKDGPFITENCSSIPETLLESELFGHKKGAFTHADRDRVGLFEQANGGTLFLDEVADMPLNMQAKLLRVLQEGEVRPVGSNKKIKVDVRLVTASNRDLAKMVKDGKFREDLFYRINGLTLRLPPLRERKQDIPALVHYLTKKIAREYDLKPSKLTAAAQQHLVKQDWPGNIRQLEGALRNAMMFADGEPLTPELFQSQHALMQESENHTPVVFEETADASPQTLTSEESERAQLIQALRRHHLDKNSVADELGITLKSVYVRMERHGIPKKNSLLAKFLDDQG